MSTTTIARKGATKAPKAVKAPEPRATEDNVPAPMGHNNPPADEPKPDPLAEAQKGDRIVYHVGQCCGGLHRHAAARD